MPENDCDGGKWALEGFLYQILGSAQHIANIVNLVSIGDDKNVRNLLITLEPSIGGDTLVEDADKLIVEQYKTKSSNRPWSFSEIVHKVLPDLYKVSNQYNNFRLLTYKFITNGRVVSKQLSLFLNELKTVNSKKNIISSNLAIKYKNKNWTVSSLFNEILNVIGEHAEEHRLRHLLSNLCIEDQKKSESYKIRIDELLYHIVDTRDDIAGKHHELIQRLYIEASKGNTINPCQFLKSMNLSCERLIKRKQLLNILNIELEDSLNDFNYISAEDARLSELSLQPKQMSILTADSGYGKTWELCKHALKWSQLGRPSILLSDVRSSTRLREQLIDKLWYSLDHDQKVPLQSVLKRISEFLLPQHYPYLTIFIDDIQEQSLVLELTKSEWKKLPIRFVISSQHRIKRFTEYDRESEKISVYHIKKFNLKELRYYFGLKGMPWAVIPKEVQNTLKIPILAKLYSEISEDKWCPDSEYELMDKYWQFATAEYRGQDAFLEDREKLIDLAFSVLKENTTYPWPSTFYIRQGLADKTRLRLIKVGLITCNQRQEVSFSHDRILNWAVATSLSHHYLNKHLTIKELSEILGRLSSLKIDWEGPLLRRLKNVCLDVLWILSSQIEPDNICYIVNHLTEQYFSRWRKERFVCKVLPTIGKRALPVLFYYAFNFYKEEKSKNFALCIAQGITTICNNDSNCLVDSNQICALLAHKEFSVQTVGISLAKEFPDNEFLKPLWDCHCNFIKQSSEENIDYQFSWSESKKALTLHSIKNSDWLLLTLDSVDDEKLVLFLLAILEDVPYNLGQRLWQQTKSIFFNKVEKNNWNIPNAISYFHDTSEIKRLMDYENSRGASINEVRLNALISLSPDKSIEYILGAPEKALRIFGNSWLDRFLFRKSELAFKTLLNKFYNNKTKETCSLAIIYHGYEHLLNIETLVTVLFNFERMLKEHFICNHFELTWEEIHFLRLISKIKNPTLLEYLSSQNTNKLDDFLSDWAIKCYENNDSETKYNLKLIRKVLLVFSGNGYKRLAFFLLRDLQEDSQINPFNSLIWYADDKEVSQIINDINFDSKFQYDEANDLMMFLGVIENYDKLADLIRNGVGLSYDVANLCQKKTPFSDEIIELLRSDLESGGEEVCEKSLYALAISSRKDVFEIIFNALQKFQNNQKMVKAVVFALDNLGLYKNEILDVLSKHFSNEKVQGDIFNYIWVHAEKDVNYLINYLIKKNGENVYRGESGLARVLLKDARYKKQMQDLLWLQIEKNSYLYELNIFALAKKGDKKAIDNLYDMTSDWQGTISGESLEAIRVLSKTDPDFTWDVATSRLKQNSTLDIADVLLKINPDKAIVFLLNLLLSDSPTLAHWNICRAFRLYADINMLIPRINSFSKSSIPERRKIAAEVLGWLPPGNYDDRLSKLAWDKNAVVEQTALSAMKMQQEQNWILSMYDCIDKVDRKKQWLYLKSILNLHDPRLIENKEDPIGWFKTINKLPLEFYIYGRKILYQNIRDLENKAKEQDR